MLENNDFSQVIIKDCVDGGCNREVTPFLCNRMLVISYS